MHEVWEQKDVYLKQIGGLEKAPRENDASVKFWRPKEKIADQKEKEGELSRDRHSCVERHIMHLRGYSQLRDGYRQIFLKFYLLQVCLNFGFNSGSITALVLKSLAPYMCHEKTDFTPRVWQFLIEKIAMRIFDAGVFYTCTSEIPLVSSY